MNKVKYLLPRRIREGFGELKQLLLQVKDSDASKRKAYKSYFENTGTIFIHIPKCAGTSVAIALYGEDPWHFSVKDYTEEQLDSSEVFAVYRDPVDRFLSSYNYLRAKAHNYPKSIYTDALSCKSPEEFFKKHIHGKKDSEINYFLRSQYWYLTDATGQLRVNHLINMDNLEAEFPSSVRKIFDFHKEFPKKNIANTTKKQTISDELESLLKTHYQADYEIIENKI